MNKRKSTNDFSTILSSFLILLLVVGVVGFLFIRTENFTTPLKEFYVRVGNDDIIADRDNFDIYTGKDYKFEIKTSISVSGSNTKYYVSVLPNETPTTTFSFNVGEETKNYADMESLTKGFAISTYEDYFIFRANMDMQSILALYYPTQTLTNVPTALDTGLPYFTLAITSADKTETININFNLIKQNNYEQDDNIEWSLTIIPKYFCRGDVGMVEFDTNKIVLTNNDRISTFSFTISSGFEFVDFTCDLSIFKSTIENNTCIVSLIADLDNSYTCDLIFNIQYSSVNDDYYLMILAEENEYGGYITFSRDHLILNNKDREMSFDFTIQDGYGYNLEYDDTQDIFVVTISGNTCTVKLIDGVILSATSTYILTFYVYSN